MLRLIARGSVLTAIGLGQSALAQTTADAKATTSAAPKTSAAPAPASQDEVKATVFFGHRSCE